MLISTPRAPWMEISSRSGEEMARCAASSARCSPLAMPVPISAMPMPVMMVRTSAKSTFRSDSPFGPSRPSSSGKLLLVDKEAEPRL
jgi:hypothetical protein